MQILIFKTNVSQPDEVNRVELLFTSIPAIRKWNFDLQDCDRILRIIANELNPRHIELLLRKEGIQCMELDD